MRAGQPQRLGAGGLQRVAAGLAVHEPPQYVQAVPDLRFLQQVPHPRDAGMADGQPQAFVVGSRQPEAGGKLVECVVHARLRMADAPL